MQTESLIKQRKEEDILASRNTDTASVRTVCLALGPYRNLTTLTGSILFLHPNCQVLNHAGERIFNDDRLDFLKDYSRARFENFLRCAIYISQTGQRGTYGGSITFSHAFDDQHAVKRVFQDAGGKLLKEDVRALFWKESLITSNHLRGNRVNLASIFSREQRLRFLLPVRNPIDCALSNLKSGHIKYFQNLNERPSTEQVLDAILDELAWCEDLRTRFPDRIFVYFAHSFGESTLVNLARFLELPEDQGWCRTAISAFDLKGRYDFSSALLAFYRDSVMRKFVDYPDFKKNLLAFTSI